MPRLRARHIAVVWLLLAAAPLTGQERILVTGQVTDSEGRPLAGATVEVPGTYWSTQAQPGGRFELHVPSGAVQLRASRAGHAPATVSLRVDGASPEPILLRLEPIPITLQGLSVAAPRTPPLAQTVTTETVRQVPPLAEPDVFRAVVLLPGVSQPNDLKGRIHLAGGASDETGVRLDHHPLQDPFHLLGLFGAFNVAALERADVLIHHLPASMDGRLSGIIDLESRRPEADPAGEAVVSILTGGATVVSPTGLAGVDLLVSARTTYLDRVLPHLAPDAPRMGFHEGLLRVGRSWGGDWRAELLGFTTRDVYRENHPDPLRVPRPLTWGESLLGVRAARSGTAWSMNFRASFNRAGVHLDERGSDPAPGSRGNYVDSRRDWWSGAMEVSRTAGWWRARAGASLDRRHNRQVWTARGLIDEIFSPSTPPEYSGEQTQTALGVYGEGGVEMGNRWTASAGGRLWGAGRLLFAPRLSLGFRAADGLHLEGALGRRYQLDAQLEEPIEGSITAPLFLVDQPRVADVAALSARWHVGRPATEQSGTIQAQAFWKEYRDRTLLAAPGVGVEENGAAFPEFDRTSGYSAGLLLSGTLSLASEALVQGSYTFQRVRERIAGELFPTAWDAPHTVSLFGSAPLARGWTGSAVYQGHSGRATTPVVARTFEPVPGTLTTLGARYIRGRRNSVRVPAYHRLDLGARRSWRARGAEWTLALQVLNALVRENAIDYDWQQYFGRLTGSSDPTPGRTGLPVVPSVGLEVKW